MSNSKPKPHLLTYSLSWTK